MYFYHFLHANLNSSFTGLCTNFLLNTYAYHVVVPSLCSLASASEFRDVTSNIQYVTLLVLTELRDGNSDSGDSEPHASAGRTLPKSGTFGGKTPQQPSS